MASSLGNSLQEGDLDSWPIETLLVVFFNAKGGVGFNFMVESRYVQSKFSRSSRMLYAENAAGLSSKYNLTFHWNQGSVVSAVVPNPNRLSLGDFRGRLRDAILAKSSQYPLEFRQKETALALIGLRGSPDFARSYYSVDALASEPSRMSDIALVLRDFGSLLNLTNLNLSQRGLRDPQVRLDLWWVRNNIHENLRAVNPYKAALLDHN